MQSSKEIDAITLRDWIANKKAINILDVRPIHEREEWYIPQSIHINAYDKLKEGHLDALEGLYLDKSIPVVTFCAGGKTSLIASEILQVQGYEAYSLKGGMKSWSLAWNKAELSMPNFEIIQFRRTGKGCLSYMIISDCESMIIDASLSIEVYEGFLSEKNLKLKYVADTHIHADHLSRTKLLAESNGLIPQIPENDKISYEFNPIMNLEVFIIGKIQIKAIQTPGHTTESMCYLIDDKVLLTGDTLFINGVGRPDLKADKNQAIAKAKLLFNSIQQILKLDKETIILPGHTSKPIDFDEVLIQTTLEKIKNNVEIIKMNESDFVATLLQRIPSTPSNYLSIVEHNISGDFSDVEPIDLEAGANRCAIS